MDCRPYSALQPQEEQKPTATVERYVADKQSLYA